MTLRDECKTLVGEKKSLISKRVAFLIAIQDITNLAATTAATLFSIMEWNLFNNGNTIGSKGSEGGVIIDDIQCVERARITLEKDGTTAPFSITLGIYHVMFHTHFVGTEEEARDYIANTKLKISAILDFMDTPEYINGRGFPEKLSQLLTNLTES